MIPAKSMLLGVTGLVLLGLQACAETPEQPPAQAQSIDSRIQSCTRLVRRVRYACNDQLRDSSGRKNTARTNYDCMALRLEFQRDCSL